MVKDKHLRLSTKITNINSKGINFIREFRQIRGVRRKKTNHYINDHSNKISLNPY